MLGELTFRVQNILDHQGLGIAVTGLVIVFVSLALITLAIATMPKVLAALEGFLPPEHHAPPAAKPSSDEALAVAIGFALHTRAANSKDKNR